MSTNILSTGLLESNEKPKSKITNQTVLTVTTTLFAAFVIGEIIGALAGNSLSLLGDAAAMSVDVITYLTNMYAERIKSSGQTITEKMRMVLEVYVPMFSVMALLGVTVWITFDAVEVILSKGDSSDDVNVYFLYGFSSGNFLLDLISFAMFYWRGSEVFKTLEETGFRNPLLGSIDFTELDKDERIIKRGSYSENKGGSSSAVTKPLYDTNGNSTQPNDDTKFNVFLTEVEAREVEQAKTRLNLNMCSAFTHLTGDSMRSASVFIAAVVSSTSNISGNLCDAWAAVIVTGTIVILVIPLVHQIWKASYPRPEPKPQQPELEPFHP